MSRKSAYCFTINNYTEDDVRAVSTVKCKGMKAGYEIAPTTGTPHIQGAVYWKDPVTMSTANRRLGGRAALFVMGGTWEDQDYCLKDGKILRNDGEGPSQGKRTDIEKFKDAIENGLTLRDAYKEYPGMMARYPRFYKEYKSSMNADKFRDWMTKGTWYYGETGVGKSHKAFENFNPSTCYVHEASDKGWWDGYDGHDTVIINEFRGEIPYAELLSLVDKWPKCVSRRGCAPVPFVAKHVIITSSLPPEKVYWRQNEKDDSIEQLKRRFQIIHLEPSVNSAPAAGSVCDAI